MAFRVLVRSVSVLSRSSSHTPVTSRLIPNLVAEVHRSPLWATLGERHLSDTSTAGEKDYFQIAPKRTKLDNLVDEATESEDILQAWVKHPGNGNQAGIVLKKWAHLVIKTKGKFKDQPPELLEDPRLKTILTTVSQDVSSVWNGNLVSTLQILWTINLPPTHPVLNSVQIEVLWRIRRFTYKQLSHLIVWGASSTERHDEAIVNAALKQLELRWSEIADAKTLTALISKGDRMSPTLLDRLEDKALEFAEDFSSKDICEVCKSLAFQSRRSVPLLRALSYQLLQKPLLDFTTPRMLDMAFAFGKLHFNNTELFQRIASRLLPRVAELSSDEVVRFAKSFALLKWLHIPLFDAFAEHFITNKKSYSLLSLSNLLMSFAQLGFQPTEVDEFFTKVHPSLENSLSKLETFLQTDVAWSLCVLQQARPEYLIPLLKEENISTLKICSSTRKENYRLKLLHIAASLQLEDPGSFDTATSQRALLAIPCDGVSSGLTPLQTSLREVLHNVVNNRKDALRVGVDTIFGWNIDGEIVVDRDNKPVSLTSFKAPHLPDERGEEPLPEGAQRIAFLALDFHNFHPNSKNLLGRSVLRRRQLQLAGFITVEVPHFDWLQLKTDNQQLSYLKDKIGKAVAEDMAK